MYIVAHYYGTLSELPWQGGSKTITIYNNEPNFGTPKIVNFPFGTIGKLIILSVPILKHIMVQVMKLLKVSKSFNMRYCINSDPVIFFLGHTPGLRLRCGLMCTEMSFWILTETHRCQ